MYSDMYERTGQGYGYRQDSSLPVGVHRGKLAGLSEEERHRAMREYKNRHRSSCEGDAYGELKYGILHTGRRASRLVGSQRRPCGSSQQANQRCERATADKHGREGGGSAAQAAGDRARRLGDRSLVPGNRAAGSFSAKTRSTRGFACCSISRGGRLPSRQTIRCA